VQGRRAVVALVPDMSIPDQHEPAESNAKHRQRYMAGDHCGSSVKLYRKSLSNSDNRAVAPHRIVGHILTDNQRVCCCTDTVKNKQIAADIAAHCTALVKDIQIAAASFAAHCAVTAKNFQVAADSAANAAVPVKDNQAGNRNEIESRDRNCIMADVSTLSAHRMWARLHSWNYGQFVLGREGWGRNYEAIMTTKSTAYAASAARYHVTSSTPTLYVYMVRYVDLGEISRSLS
jgi:hypothetical protein